MFQRLLAVSIMTLMVQSPLRSQGDPVAAGRTAMNAYDLTAARRHLEEAVRRDPDGYEAIWRLALVLVDVGTQIREPARRASRDSVYRAAESYARRAVAANSADAEGHFVLANALGRRALSLGKRDRLKAAAEIKAQAERAIALDARHHGALHVLGRWHAEIKGLSSVERFLAKNVLGGKGLAAASWDEAERNMQLAVRYGPNIIYHRLDLAEVLDARKKWTAAKEQVDAIAAMTPRDPSDVRYQAEAMALGAQLARKLRP